MGGRDLITLLGGIAADAATAALVPFGGTLVAGGTVALDRVLSTRARTAARLLEEELKAGRVKPIEVADDEAAAITFRYLRAATEGAARLNLRLLGSCIAGQARADTLYADEFLRWADILASLRPDEVKLLAIAQRAGLSDQEDGSGVRWKDVAELAAAEMQLTTKDVYGIASALARTGCIHALSGWGAPVYEPTRIFHQMIALVDIEGAIQRDESDQPSTSSK